MPLFWFYKQIKRVAALARLKIWLCYCWYIALIKLSKQTNALSWHLHPNKWSSIAGTLGVESSCVMLEHYCYSTTPHPRQQRWCGAPVKNTSVSSAARTDIFKLWSPLHSCIISGPEWMSWSWLTCRRADDLASTTIQFMIFIYKLTGGINC